MKHYLSGYQAVDKQCLNELYFTSFFTQFNWAYSSYDENHGFIQKSFAFSLYLLIRYGDYFINAFPDLLLDIEESHYSPEDSIKHCYGSWVFELFAHYFGSAEIQDTANERGYLTETEVKATPLLKAFVHCIDKSRVIKGNFIQH
jgi:hypothetical protein